ncbi:MAG: helix-turn-helix transcriptional regulator [Balneolaceae bacterium]
MELNFFSAIILLGIAQGIFLFISLQRIKEVNKEANRLLSAFILLISLTMIGRFLLELNVDSVILSFLALPDSIIFLYGPILYFYLQRLLLKPVKRAHILAHFIPVILFIISGLPSLLNDTNPIHVLWLELTTIRFIIIEGGAILHNTIYFYLGLSLFSEYQRSSNNEFSFKQYPSYLKVLFSLIALTIVAWAVSYLSWVTANYNILSAIGYRTVWVILPFITYAMGFFAIRQPELFKISIDKTASQKAPINEIEEIEELKEKVHKCMMEETPFLNPKLSLEELANLTGIKRHLLSRVINTGFKQNFSDYVNSYRINEFKKLVQREDKKDFTILAIALEAGFNSKTTFNTTFKKLTGGTPNEFASSIKKMSS